MLQVLSVKHIFFAIKFCIFFIFKIMHFLIWSKLLYLCSKRNLFNKYQHNTIKVSLNNLCTLPNKNGQGKEGTLLQNYKGWKCLPIPKEKHSMQKNFPKLKLLQSGLSNEKKLDNYQCDDVFGILRGIELGSHDVRQRNPGVVHDG